MPTVDQVLARAHAALNRGTVYWLDAGGLDPRAPVPTTKVPVAQAWAGLTPDKRVELTPIAEAMGIDVNAPHGNVDACDCSGFVCWALGFSRKADGQAPYTTKPDYPGGACWIYTDSIYADATSVGERFRHIERARPGALVVYPHDLRHDYGHIALVLEADANGRATRIIHCSKANNLSEPYDGIKVTTPEAFDDNTASIYAWCATVE